MDEREQLAATLGATLRGLRAEHRVSTRRLALRAAVARSTITRLEAGQRRPRRSLLNALATGLDPDRRPELLELLVAAAGPSLRPESEGSVRARQRRLEAGLLAGTTPLPSDLARRLTLHQSANAARRRAYELTDAPGALNNSAVLAESSALLELSRKLREQAGPPVILRIGGHTIRAGWP